MNCGAVQCGFCVPGFIVSAYALLEQNPDPTREEVRDWFQKTRNVMPLYRIQTDRRCGYGCS
ncbi:MAG: 2Fe-2S iron-sulfur cluster-binding protein [Gallintestinimicrobium sp.]